MSLIQVTPEHLHTQARNIRKYNDKQEETMSRIRRLIYSLDESWKGEAQRAFVQKFQSMESIYRKLTDVLNEYAKLMDRTAEEMQKTDQDVLRMIKNI